ncbi:hypothetical protein [Streptomyces pseudovenezuelae]|uniref:Clp ATPase C-terminal domain-containing protein n=1 Tax=Streptomyces pseudovenezuelae TaxID=67350 RepID=A0ABT6LAP5_9ACTN|nr:hypothetical protein [Streptomyces pseudovenezuelae]MDH6213357.1 hypothetical protein [Streptomyces pseudovenezuelae]
MLDGRLTEGDRVAVDVEDGRLAFRTDHPARTEDTKEPTAPEE